MALAFTRVQSPGLDGPIVHYRENEANRPFMIQASRHGVRLCSESPTISTDEDLQTLAKTIAMAWQEHKKLHESVPVARIPDA